VRYFLATLAAAVLIALGVLDVLYVRMTVAPALAPGGGIELPGATMWLVWVSDMIIDFWWLLLPLVFIVCFGIARFFGPRTQRPSHDSVQ
jgi:type II secretory pathway component PulF